MIEFKKTVKELLPYQREKYFKYIGWYGVSFQIKKTGKKRPTPHVKEGKNVRPAKKEEIPNQ